MIFFKNVFLRFDFYQDGYSSFDGRWGYRGVIIGWDETGVQSNLVRSPKYSKYFKYLTNSFLQPVHPHPGWRRCTKGTRTGAANPTLQFWWGKSLKWTWTIYNSRQTFFKRHQKWASMSRKSYLPTLKKETLQGGHERPSRPTDHLCASREPGSDEAHGHPPPIHRGDSLLHEYLFKTFFCNRTILRTSMGHNTYRGPGWEQFIQETKHNFVDWTGNTRAQETHSNEKFSYLGFWICGFIFFPAGLS